MTLHRLLPLLAVALNVLLMGGALGSGRRSPRNLRFALLTLALAVWSFGVFGLRWSADDETALAWERFIHVGVIAIPALFYDYVLVFLNLPRRLTLAVAYVGLALFLIVMPMPAFIAGVEMTRWGFAPVEGPAYVAFIVYFHAYLVGGLVLLLHAYRRAMSSFRKNRILLVVLGVTIGVLGGLTDFLRFLLDSPWVYPIGIPCNAVFAVALGVAIIRYRLMDISVLAKRALLYVIALSLLGPLVILALEAAARLVPLDATLPAGARSTRDAVVVVALLAVALPVLRNVQEVLDRVMFRRRYAVRDALLALSKDLSATLETEPLGRTLTDGLGSRIPTLHASLHLFVSGRLVRVAESTAPGVADAVPTVPDDVLLWLRVAKRALVIEDPAFLESTAAPAAAALEELESRRVALVVPLFLEAELAGVLVVGEKLSGEIFDSDEIELLDLLVRQAATALKNVSLYEALKREMDELRTTQQLYGQAQEADRAKEQFLATLAHELRNPLSPIVTALHVAREIATESRVTRLLAIAQRQAKHLARLMEDLLDVSRIRIGKITLRRKLIDVRDVVDRCLEDLATSGRSSGRDIACSMPPEPVVVEADPDRLQQIVANLVDNALKYTPADGRIRVTVTRAAKEAVIVVTDTGIGIAPDVLPRVFEIFTQADAEPRSGLGLGLALVRALVEQHGGTVAARSGGVGAGSEFVVRLPLRPELVVAEPETPASPRERARRILIIEDNADARNTLRTLLEMSGHRVEIAGSGEEGLRVARRFEPEIAVIDIGLPDIDGYQVARHLRSIHPRGRIYLVALTGYGQPEDRRRAMESGFDAHLVKPIEPASFLHVLDIQD